MPRHPKPIDLRARRESHRHALLAPRPRVAKGPPAPAGLLASSRAAWVSFWASPLARMVEPDTDLPALTRLWTLYDERARMSRVTRTQRVVPGHRGQPRPNPLYRVMIALDAAIVQLEDRFGLSPRARLALGVYLGTGDLADLNAELEDATDLAALYTADKETRP